MILVLATSLMVSCVREEGFGGEDSLTELLDIAAEASPRSRSALSGNLNKIDYQGILLRGWSGPVRREKIRFRWGLGRESVLEFSLDRPSPLVLSLHGRFYGPQRSQSDAIVVRLNGEEVGALVLETEWPEEGHSVEVPSSATRKGANMLSLVYPKGMQDPPQETLDRKETGVAWKRFDIVRPGYVEVNPELQEILIPANESLELTAQVSADVALHMGGLTLRDGAENLRVEWEIEGQDSSWTKLIKEVPRVDLSLAEQAGLLTLVLSAEGPDSSSVRLEQAVLKGSAIRAD